MERRRSIFASVEMSGLEGSGDATALWMGAEGALLAESTGALGREKKRPVPKPAAMAIGRVTIGRTAAMGIAGRWEGNERIHGVFFGWGVAWRAFGDLESIEENRSRLGMCGVMGAV
jgi:hypothetical protein